MCKVFQKPFIERATRANLSVYIAVIMEMMRDSWTDERLDDGFDRTATEIQSVKTEVESVKTEIQSVRKEVQYVKEDLKYVKEDLKSHRAEMREDFRDLAARLDGLQRTFTQLCAGMIVALIGLIATQV